MDWCGRRDSAGARVSWTSWVSRCSRLESDGGSNPDLESAETRAARGVEGPAAGRSEWETVAVGDVVFEVGWFGGAMVRETWAAHPLEAWCCSH